MKASIRLKLLILTLGVICLVGGSISLYSVYLGRDKIFKGFLKESMHITTLLSSTVADDLYELDVFSLRLTLKNTHISPDLRECYVMDVEGVVLADGTAENRLRDQIIPDPFIRQVLNSDDLIFLRDEKMLRVGRPIAMADSTHIGYIYLVFSLDGVTQIVQDSTQASLLITIVFLGMGALLVFFLSGSFTRPILEIVKAAKTIGRGKFDTRVQIKSKDELGLLGLSINQLAVDLRERTVSKDYFNKIITSMSDLLVVVNPELTINTVNNAMLKLLGYQANELLGKSLSLIFSGKLNEIRDLIKKGMIKTVETTFLTKEGHIIPVSFSASVMKDGSDRVEGIVCVSRDITKRKRVEDELKQYRNHLEELVQARTVELHSKNKELSKSQEALTSLLEDVNTSRIQLDEANQKLKELDTLKSMFIASMSHELRTPLNSIIGFTGIILQGMSGEINPDQKDQLKRVYGSALHLLELITEIIDISKIEAGKLETYPTRFPLEEVIIDAVENLKAQIDEKGLRIETDMPPYIRLKSDRTRLLQCILNYLSNAVKFTEQGKISIVVKEADNMLEISVKDTGIGIKKTDFQKLFTSFTRFDSSLKPKPLGTGLGLYLTKKLAEEILGGSVEVESQYGKGSTFTLKIPKDCGALQSNGKEFSDEQSAHHRRQ